MRNDEDCFWCEPYPNTEKDSHGEADSCRRSTGEPTRQEQEEEMKGTQGVCLCCVSIAVRHKNLIKSPGLRNPIVAAVTQEGIKQLDYTQIHKYH